ncbi:hypothetical protein DY218_27455 [Streptomyces triticagri]|uniref:Uncharacterized protein n=1 Tax=Streptomyces triticagri TaxID=2293568 RepID=A0A372M036_9ACTN|nr:hypothetical protein [Streptomyces triticagri]RFU83647.1 hypothetical protein DY218_27455 [Streptomyces triticagri]
MTDQEPSELSGAYLRSSAIRLAQSLVETLEALPDEAWTRDGRSRVSTQRTMTVEQATAHELAWQAMLGAMQMATTTSLALSHMSTPVAYGDPAGTNEAMAHAVRTHVRTTLQDPLLIHLLDECGRKPFTCPKCQHTSRHPRDIEQGYCGNCHDWTGTPS